MARRSGSPFYVRRDYGGNADRFARRTEGLTGNTGVLTVSWDLQPMLRMAQAIRGEAGNADTAIRGAHAEMASLVAGYAQDVLEQRVHERGREQKPSRALLKAIGDERNRESDLRGFSVGYLDRIEEVKLYWRRIEEGSDTQVGDVFYGMFQNAGGQWRWPTREGPQTDLRLLRFSQQGPVNQGGAFKSTKQRALDGEENTGGKTPLIHIQNPIPAYNFLGAGFQRWGIRDGAWTDEGITNVLSTYALHFDKLGGGEGFLARWFSRFGTSPAGTRPTRTYGSLAPGTVKPGSF